MNNKFDNIYDIDKNEIFRRITTKIENAENISDEIDFSPFNRASAETKQPSAGITMNRYFSAAAAVIIFAAVLPMIILIGKQSDIEKNDTDTEPLVTTYSYEEQTEEIPDSSVIVFPPSDGWSYSNVSVSNAKSYSVPETEEITPYYENNTVSELFSEKDVLSRTDFFLDCIVLDREYDEFSGKVLYTVEPVHIVSDKTVTLYEQTVISSGTAYILDTGHEYLIPVEINGDEFEAADKSSPQTEITEERFIMFHNGWKELTSDSERIDCRKTAPDDFFYDRMNITGESSLEQLFEVYLNYY